MIHYRMNSGEIIMAKIAMYIHLSRETIPPFFEGCWEGPSGFYRAIDWEDYLSVILPCVVLQFIADPIAKKMIMSLVNGCNWSMQRKITAEDLDVIQGYNSKTIYQSIVQFNFNVLDILTHGMAILRMKLKPCRVYD